MDDRKDLHDSSDMNPEEHKLNPQAATADNETEPEPPPTVRQWLARNGLVLLIFAAFCIYLFNIGGLLALWNALKVVLGLGFVIFIHELGHFLVAKWCDVNVTTFSVGFGPAIPGCKYQWGETTYMIGVIPLGGYVQMVGQVDLDERDDGTEEDPRSYKNKSVWQRMAIISAGVVMNAILAVVCFAVVFLGPGKDRRAAVIDIIDPGSPAFKNGLKSGSQIVQIGSIANPMFEDLLETVMNTLEGQKIDVVYQIPGQPALSVPIEPRVSGGRPLIGIVPGSRLQLIEERAMRLMYPGSDSPLVPHSAAARATGPKGPFAYEDIVVAMTDPDDPSKITDLPNDPRVTKKTQPDFFEFARRMELLGDREVTVRVHRKDGTAAKITVPPTYHRVLDLRMQMGEITAVRRNSPADKAGVQVRDANRKLGDKGDVIEAVEVADANGESLIFTGNTLDPVRLPSQLQAWADQLYAQEKEPSTEDLTVKIRVRRDRSEPGHQYETKDLELIWDHSWRFQRIAPFSKGAPMPIPELGLAFQIKTTVLDAPADSEVLAGDVIKSIRLYTVDKEGKETAKEWFDLEPDNWALTFLTLQVPNVANKLEIKVERTRESKPEMITLTTTEDQSWPNPDRGFVWSPDTRLQKADNVFSAVAFGLEDTHKRMLAVYRNIRGIFMGRISAEHLAGPITIAQIAYRVAGFDIWEFIFLIGMISINLAVINFLPIPVLDGGHMVFLIYEKIRGRPASEAIRNGAMYAGLALILMLMVFVVYQDIARLIRGS